MEIYLPHELWDGRTDADGDYGQVDEGSRTNYPRNSVPLSVLASSSRPHS